MFVLFNYYAGRYSLFMLSPVTLSYFALSVSYMDLPT